MIELSLGFGETAPGSERRSWLGERKPARPGRGPGRGGLLPGFGTKCKGKLRLEPNQERRHKANGSENSLLLGLAGEVPRSKGVGRGSRAEGGG